MKSLKEIIQNLYEKTDYYKLEKLREEWEDQNIKIDEQQSEINKLNKKYNKLKKELELEVQEKAKYIKDSSEAIEFRINEIKKLEETNLKINEKLKEKEQARRKLAGKIGGFQKQINKLEYQVEFLKTNRRSPNLEEIKDYEYRRKRGAKDE